MPAYNRPAKRTYPYTKGTSYGGVVKRGYGTSGRSGGGTPMQIVASGVAPLRTGGFWGTRRTGQEKKTVDVDPTVVAVNTTGSVTLLNGIATGTDFTDRIGRKVLLKSIQLRWQLEPTDQVVGGNLCRIVIVYDAQTNGAAPAVTDVLKSASPLANVNLNNRDRFQILFDKTYLQLFAANTATQAVAFGQAYFRGKLYRRLKHEMVFGGTTAAVGSIQTGSIYLITIGSNIATADSQLSFTSRIRFMDA